MNIRKKNVLILVSILILGITIYAVNSEYQIESTRAVGGPVGSITMWAVNNLPADYLECNGQAVSRTTYADLFAVLGTSYGVGDGSTTFNLPDYRGQFLRGRDNGAGIDPDADSRTDRGDGTTGDAVGTKQDSENKRHNHWANKGMAFLIIDAIGYSLPASGKSVDISYTTTYSGGKESRPKNISVIFIIKVK